MNTGFNQNWEARTENPNEWETIGENVCMVAKEIFNICECPKDYCIQDNSGFGTVVFGSVNRIIWRISTGFRIDKGYCTPEFIQKFPAAVKEMEEFY
jgi:hypothetical protein